MRTSAAYSQLLLLLALGACGGLHALAARRGAALRVPSNRAEVEARIRELVNLEGEYVFGDAVYGIVVNERTLDEIAAADTIGIRPLVACLSDTRRTHVTLHGKRVTVGLLCAEALTSTAYFQTALQRRAFPDGWRGMPPLAADSSLGRVQQAWLQWLHEHQLTWPLLPGYVPPCPARDSVRPERFHDSLSTNGSRRAQQRIAETLADFRFVTYVVDSEFVVLSDSRPRTASDSVRSGSLEGLSVDDIGSISVRRSESEAWKWRACEGVPVALIVTRSKRWRPPGSPSSRH